MCEFDRNWSYVYSINEYYFNPSMPFYFAIFIGVYNTLIRTLVVSHPIENINLFNKHQIFENNWITIKNEAIKSQQYAKSFASLDPIFKRLDDDGRWRVIILKWYSEEYPSRNLAPFTTGLIENDSQIKCAMFSILDGRKKIPPHRGPYAGSLRYHLGLACDSKAFIKIDNQVYTWKNGESVLFDDTYMHEVENNSDEMRIILFMDILRPIPKPFQYVHEWINSHANFSSSIYNLNKKAEQVFDI